MPRTALFPASLSIVALALSIVSAPPLAAQTEEPIAGWTAPPYWTPPAPRAIERSKEAQIVEPMTAETLPSGPLPFVAIPPCRVVDTRNAPGPYGGPGLVGNAAARAFNIPGGPCSGIPSDAGAYSINVAAILPAADGFLTVFPTGTSQPTASDLNFLASKVISNSLITPAGTGGSISVFVNVTTGLTIDINGYYRAVPIVNSINGQSGAVTIPTLPAGTTNQTLRNDGTNWVPNGAVTSDGTNGWVNGTLTLPAYPRINAALEPFIVETSFLNLFVGRSVGSLTTTGPNTAVGSRTFTNNTTGYGNTVIGDQALRSNTNGNRNTAVGSLTLDGNVSGADNTAVGYGALTDIRGSGNIGLGMGAGEANSSGSNNMYLGNGGVSGESNTIRLGSGGGVHTRLFLAGVLGTNIGSGSPIYINSVGQVGLVSSSARYKEDIRDMGDASDRLLTLRPVTFRYKDHEDDPTQFGLVAEEVEKVLPELVFHDSSGRPETVLYQEMPAMLLNEIQKERCRIEEEEAEIAAQRREIADLQARLEAIEGRLAEGATK